MAHESYTVAQASRLLGLSAPTIRRMAAEGDLAAFRTPGGHLRITQEGLEAARRSNKEKGEAPRASPVLRNRRERVEELVLQAQEIRALHDIERLRRERAEEQAQLEAEAEARERQSEREAEAVELRRERLRLQEAREAERRARERELSAFRVRWLQQAEKILGQFRYRWLPAVQRQQVLEACEAAIRERQVGDEPCMASLLTRTINATVEPWERERENRDRRAAVLNRTLSQLPWSASEQERAQAATLIREALEKIPASAAEFEVRVAAEEAIAGLRRAIQRRELTENDAAWAVQQLPFWKATEVDKSNLRRQCLEALTKLPEDISESDARVRVQRLVREACKQIEAREARAERQRRKSQLVTQGVQEAFNYLSELVGEGEVSSRELDDSEFREEIERAVRDALDDELSGEETPKELQERVREVVDDELN